MITKSSLASLVSSIVMIGNGAVYAYLAPEQLPAFLMGTGLACSNPITSDMGSGAPWDDVSAEVDLVKADGSVAGKLTVESDRICAHLFTINS